MTPPAGDTPASRIDAAFAFFHKATFVLAGITIIYCGSLVELFMRDSPRESLHSVYPYFFAAPVALALLFFILPKRRAWSRVAASVVLAVLLLLQLPLGFLIGSLVGPALGVCWVIAAGVQAPSLRRTAPFPPSSSA